MLIQVKKYRWTFILVVLTVAIIGYLKSNPPQAKRGAKPIVKAIPVEVQTLEPQNFQLDVTSFGTVSPRTESALTAQVSAQVMAISPKFRTGGFFKRGDVLVELDARDYQAEVDIAKAAVFTAEQALLEEQARVAQAKLDWQRLGKKEKPSPLVLREPQLKSAQGQVLSAKARLNKALLSLERTVIKAPFDGRIRSKYVDVGQMVSINTKLADIYATDAVEVRLPIKNNDLPFLTLPDQQNDAEPIVQFYSQLNQDTWQGKLVRTEAAIDEQAQQLYVVAQISAPFTRKTASGLSLKIGQYLTAKINANPMHNVLVIPNKSIYQSSYVYVVNGDVLLRKEIEILWQNAEKTVIKTGLQAGEKLVTTPLGQVTSGTKVSIINGAKSRSKRREGKPRKAPFKRNGQQQNQDSVQAKGDRS